MSNFDWTQIAGPLLNAGGSVLGALVGGPAGAIIGPLAGKALADALGVPATPDDVGAALGKPESGSIVAQVEATHGEALKSVEETYTADVQDARATTVALVKEGSATAWGAPIVSVVAMLAFAAVAVLVMAGKSGDSASGQMILGAMIGGYTTVLSYWLGSSRGSQAKDATIADAMKSAAGAAIGAVARAVRK